MTQQTNNERLSFGVDVDQANRLLNRHDVSLETSMHMVASEAIRRELEIIGNTLGDIHDRLSEINGNIIRGEFACPFCGKEGCEHYWTERKKCKKHDDGE